LSTIKVFTKKAKKFKGSFDRNSKRNCFGHQPYELHWALDPTKQKS